MKNFLTGKEMRSKREDPLPPRLTWPEIPGFTRVTDGMELEERCDKHPAITYWECWEFHFKSKGIKVQTRVMSGGDRTWVAIYRKEGIHVEESRVVVGGAGIPGADYFHH